MRVVTLIYLLLILSCEGLAAQADAVLQTGQSRAAVYYPPGYVQVGADRQWPVILFSHGFAGSALSQDILLEKMATLGWLVIAIEHSDPVAFERIPPAKGDWKWKVLSYMKHHPFSSETYDYRPKEFRVFVKWVAENLPVDRDRVVFAGHSMGGYTIFNSVDNSLLSPSALIVYSTGELNYKRGKPYFTAQQLRAITVPLLLLYGEKEFDPEKGPYALEIARHYGGTATVIMLQGGGHLSYNDPTRRFGKKQRLEMIETAFRHTKQFLQALTMRPKKRGGDDKSSF